MLHLTRFITVNHYHKKIVMKKQLVVYLLLVSIFMSRAQNITSTEPTTTCNMFGTDGIRATVGHSPFTSEELIAMGSALGIWIVQTYGKNAHVLLGHDTRISCAWVKSCLKSGLLTQPITIIDAGILPTPAIVRLTLHTDHVKCGIIISASHNPFQDNGLKIIDGTRGKISLQDEQIISTLFYNHQTIPIDHDQMGSEQCYHTSADDYMNHIKQFFCQGFLLNKKIVLDCAHGATYEVAPALFTYFGAQVICINNCPNGTNINNRCGATEVQSLKHAVLAHQADVGFAFDGDGDRVMAVTYDGTLIDGDDIVALLTDHPRYKHIPTVIGTVMSNKGLENWLVSKSYKFTRTTVGDKYIARQIEKSNGTSVLGGEQSGHIILADYLPTGDGIFTALRLMEVSIMTGNRNMLTFKHMPQCLVNVPIEYKKDLTEEPYASIIRKKAELIPSGRILVRYSGTEAKLRVMVEDIDKQLANTIAQELAQTLQQMLGT